MKRWLLLSTAILGLACSKPEADRTAEPASSVTAPPAEERAAVASPASSETPQLHMAQPAEAARPAPSLPEDALLRVSSGDIHGLLDGLGGTAAQISPGMTAQTLKALIGGMLQDPELKGVPAGGGLAFVLLPGNAHAAYVEVDAAQGPQYAQALTQAGKQAEFAEGLLTIVDPAHAAEAKRLAPGITTFLKAAGKPTLEVTLSFPRLLSEYGTTIDGMIEKMKSEISQLTEKQTQGAGSLGARTDPQQMNEAMRFVELELKGLRSILGEVDLTRLEIGFEPQQIRIEKTATYVSGSPLADFLGKPFMAAPVERLKQMPTTGAVRLAIGMPETQAARELIEREVATIGQAAGINAARQEAWAQFARPMSEYMVPQAISYIDPVKGTLEGQWIYEIAQPETLIHALDSITQSFSQLGFDEIYRLMGLEYKLTFTRNFREHDGIAIHRALTQLKATTDSAQALGMVKFMNNLTFELGARGGLLYGGLGEGQLDSLLDANKRDAPGTGKPLTAESTLAGGAIMMGDLDLAGLLKYMEVCSETISAGFPNLYHGASALMEGVAPITLAAWQQPGQTESTMLIPTAAIAKAKAVGMLIQRNMMSGMQGAGMQPRLGTGMAMEQKTPSGVNATLRTLSTALEAYRIDNEVYPMQLEPALLKPIAYLTAIPNDPYATPPAPMNYRMEGEGYRIWSVGPDGKDDDGAVIYDPQQGMDSAGDIVRTNMQ